MCAAVLRTMKRQKCWIKTEEENEELRKHATKIEYEHEDQTERNIKN